ncbi:hypothetical protein DFJ74DRAFT_256606 [Hyaloraphidium curvatum]|nr:hypothetical protein DFJ74DRAFT_256606 [Hyaloraphidium curvatum]
MGDLHLLPQVGLGGAGQERDDRVRCAAGGGAEFVRRLGGQFDRIWRRLEGHIVSPTVGIDCVTTRAGSDIRRRAADGSRNRAGESAVHPVGPAAALAAAAMPAASAAGRAGTAAPAKPALRGSCDNCMASKKKCVEPPDGSPCPRCADRGLRCVRSARRKPGPKPTRQRAEDPEELDSAASPISLAAGPSADYLPLTGDSAFGTPSVTAPASPASAFQQLEAPPSGPSSSSVVPWQTGLQMNEAFPALPNDPLPSFPTTVSLPLSLQPQPVPEFRSQLPSELFTLCLSSYFAEQHPLIPLLHRARAQAYLPIPLAFAAAAAGVRHLPISLPPADSIRVVRYLVESARDTLLAGYFERRHVSDVEAVQTIILIIGVLMPLGKGASARTLMEVGSRILLETCFASLVAADGAHRADLLSCVSTSAEDWYNHELAVRAWITFASLDVNYAYLAFRKPLLDYFSFPARMPAHASVWDTPVPAMGFAVLQQLQQAPLLDFSGTVDPAAVVKAGSAAVFDLSCSHLAAKFVQTYIRLQQLNLREAASVAGVEPLEVMARDVASDTAYEAAFRIGAARVETLSAAFFAGLPPPLDLMTGTEDVDPLFSRSHEWFADPRTAYAWFSVALCLQAGPLDSWITGDATTADVSGFLGPAFLPLLSRTLAFTRCLSRAIAADRDLRHIPAIAYTPVLKVSAFTLALVDVLRGTGADVSALREDLAVLAHAHRAICASHGPVMEFATRGFRGRLLEAAAPSPPAAPVDGEDEVELEVAADLDRLTSGEIKDPGRDGRAWARIAVAGTTMSRPWVC